MHKRETFKWGICHLSRAYNVYCNPCLYMRPRTCLLSWQGHCCSLNPLYYTFFFCSFSCLLIHLCNTFIYAERRFVSGDRASTDQHSAIYTIYGIRRRSVSCCFSADVQWLERRAKSLHLQSDKANVSPVTTYCSLPSYEQAAFGTFSLNRPVVLFQFEGSPTRESTHSIVGIFNLSRFRRRRAKMSYRPGPCLVWPGLAEISIQKCQWNPTGNNHKTNQPVTECKQARQHTQAERRWQRRRINRALWATAVQVRGGKKKHQASSTAENTGSQTKRNYTN